MGGLIISFHSLEDKTMLSKRCLFKVKQYAVHKKFNRRLVTDDDWHGAQLKKTGGRQLRASTSTSVYVLPERAKRRWLKNPRGRSSFSSA